MNKLNEEDILQLLEKISKSLKKFHDLDPDPLYLQNEMDPENCFKRY